MVTPRSPVEVGGGQTHVAVDHGKSHPISARAHAIKIPSLPEHQRLNISDE